MRKIFRFLKNIPPHLNFVFERILFQMATNDSFTFPYGFPTNPFSLEEFLKSLEKSNEIPCANDNETLGPLTIHEPDNSLFFALRFLAKEPKQDICLECYGNEIINNGDNSHYKFYKAWQKNLLTTFELRDYHYSSPEECYMVLTGEEEANKKFLEYLIQAFPSTDGIKESAN